MQNGILYWIVLAALRAGSYVSHQRRISLELMRLFLVTGLRMCTLRGGRDERQTA
jgi:hypothetical protein